MARALVASRVAVGDDSPRPALGAHKRRPYGGMPLRKAPLWVPVFTGITMALLGRTR